MTTTRVQLLGWIEHLTSHHPGKGTFVPPWLCDGLILDEAIETGHVEQIGSDGCVIVYGLTEKGFGELSGLELMALDACEPIRRWHAIITYRTDAGENLVEHDLQEVGDIDPLVERGPHWDTIELIEIRRVDHNTDPNLTVETAKKL